MTFAAPPPPPPPEPTHASVGPAPGPRQTRPAWLLGLVAILLVGGALALWMAPRGSQREMREGTVTIASFADDGAADAVDVTLDSQTRTSTPDTTSPPTTAVVTVAPTSSAAPVTEAPTTTIPPATTAAPVITAAPTTVTPATTPPTAAATTAAPPVSTAVEFSGRCSSEMYGWDVGIPQGWFAADASTPSWACGAFDRAPIVLDDATEAILPITITFIEEPSSTLLASYAEGTVSEVLTDAEVAVDIYMARRLEVRATGEGMIEAGTPGIAYLVDRGGWSTVLIEGWGSTNADYEVIRQIVDALAADIVFWDS